MTTVSVEWAVAHARTGPLDALARAAALAAGTPIGLVNLLDDATNHPVGSYGMVASALPRASTLCDLVVAAGSELVVADASLPPSAGGTDLRDHPSVTDAGVASYAGFPLRNRAGDVIGSLCVVDPESRRHADEVLVVLRTLAASVVDQLENQRTGQVIADRTRLLEAVLGTVDVGVVACDADFRLVLFNDCTRRLHGVPLDASVAPEDMASHYRLLHPDGRSLLEMEEVPLRRALVEGEVVGAEMVIERVDGTRRLVRCDGKALRDEAGLTVGAVVVMADITVERDQERQLAASHAALAEREAFSRAVLDTIDVAVLACDADGRPTYVNQFSRTLSGVEGPGRELAAALVHPGPGREVVDAATGLLLDAATSPLLRSLQDGEVAGQEVVVAIPGQGRRHLLVRGREMRGDDGVLRGAVTAAHDVTGMRDQQRALRESEARFRAAFEHGPLAICRLSPDGLLLEVNPAFRRLVVRATSALVGRPFEALIAAEDQDLVAKRLVTATPTAEPVEVRVLRADGSAVWCEMALTAVPQPRGGDYVLVQLADVSARRAHELALEDAARRDPLTGLPNRAALAQLLDPLLLDAERRSGLTLLYVDLDGFKAVNDSAGHTSGDAVLVQVAQRLVQAMRSEDAVVRLGGDEFLTIHQTSDGADPDGLSTRLRRVLAEPYDVLGQLHRLGASVGVARPRPGETREELLARADRAMYRDKRGAQGRPARSHLEELVATALAEDRLSLAYQGVVDVSTGRSVGAEALVRMVDRSGLAVPPLVFVGAAEHAGLIDELGGWVLRTAMAQGLAWKKELPQGADFCIGINVSPRQVEDPAFLARVDEALAETRLDPSAVVLELTESLLLQDTASMRSVLTGLRARGLHLAVDDFGAGYASPQYLVSLPVDVLKVDRAYVAGLDDPGRLGTISSALVGFALGTGLTVVAEGVETEQQRAALEAAGCALAQGYLFGRPLPAAELGRQMLAGPS